MADTIKQGSRVEITYTILDERDEVVEASSLPINYIHGHRSGLFEQIEQALFGKSPGDTVSVTLKPEDGFGPHDPALTFTDAIANVPEEFRQVGAEVEMQNERGESRTFIVTKIEGGLLTVDGNHPFAGKVVTFHINVESVRDATQEELDRLRATSGPAPGIH